MIVCDNNNVYGFYNCIYNYGLVQLQAFLLDFIGYLLNRFVTLSVHYIHLCAEHRPSLCSTALVTSPRMAAEAFKLWADEFELSDETIQLLRDNAFTSKRSCKLLNASLIQKTFSKAMPLGQTLLLQQAVESLTDPSPGTTLSSQTTPTLTATRDVTDKDPSVETRASGSAQQLDMTSVLNLLDSGSTVPAAQVDITKHPGIFDPFQISDTTSGSSVRDIRDFVTLLHHERPERTSVRLGDVELTLPDSKPKVDNISPLQYMEASLRIMREMAIKDGDSREKILEYAGYLIKIANMGQRFMWRSVLKYDAEYRKSQASSNFPWGADSSYMMQIFLREEQNKSGTHRYEGSNPQTKYDPISRKPVCNRYNSSQGCTMKNCRYAHMCRVCFSRDHTQITHRSHMTSIGSTSKNGL